VTLYGDGRNPPKSASVKHDIHMFLATIGQTGLSHRGKFKRKSIIFCNIQLLISSHSIHTVKTH